jgi:cobaltochelatase CobT
MTESEIRSTILKRDEKGAVRNGAEWLALWSDPSSMMSRAEKSDAQAQERHRLELAGQLAASARSLSGRDDLEIAVVADDGLHSGLKVSLSELTEANMPALRGRVDSVALFLAHHDSQIHDALAPTDANDRSLFDLLELIRCEAFGAARLPGVADNIAANHIDRLTRLDIMGAHLAALVPLEEAIRMVVADVLNGRTEASIPTSGFWMWHRWMHQRLAVQLAKLRETMNDQQDYAFAAKWFLQTLYEALQGRGDGPTRREINNRTAGGNEDEELEHGGTQTDQDNSFEPGPEALVSDEKIEALPIINFVPPPRPPVYAPYTDKHDRVARAEDLVPQQVMRQAQETLEQKRSANKRTMARLVTQLQRRLMAKQTRSWAFDLEDGLIDASRLDRVIVNPGFADAYKQEEESQFRDTCVTLLIDNSGSMRGKTIELACMASDLICAALENCSVATEVLGFTTLGWKGGASAQDWMRAGRPQNPGRLNDLLHVIYKSADEPYRRAKLNLCAMMSNDLLKENVDGEALLWAARRLSARQEQRRILIVISDGAPVDQATLEANGDKAILDRHLKTVVSEIERSGQIELAALGIRHDVDRYYRHANRIDVIDELGPAVIEMLDQMLRR